jgi:hypothetical protein
MANRLETVSLPPILEGNLTHCYLGNYPHTFGNGENLPFPCGRSTMEFPLDRDDPGSVYSGQSVKTLPDRLVFEFKDGKKEGKAKFCGVMRHGNNGDFIDCP